MSIPRFDESSQKRFLCWREFLKRSEKYEKICIAIRAGQDIDAVFIDQSDKISAVYSVFQDVFSESEEEFLCRIKVLYKSEEEDIIEYYSPIISGFEYIKKLAYCKLLSLEMAFGEDFVTAKEYYESLMYSLGQLQKFKHIVVVDFSGSFNKIDIEQEFKAFLSREYDKDLYKQKMINRKNFSMEKWKENGQMPYDYFADAIALLDCESLEWDTKKDKVNYYLNKYKPNVSTDSNEDRRSTYKKAKKRALTVLNNAEKGNFPGKYS